MSIKSERRIIREALSDKLLDDLQNIVFDYLELDIEGIFLGHLGSQGTADGKFVAPMGIAGNGKNIFVCDEGNNRIQVFDTKNRFVRKFGTYGDEDGEFKSPRFIYFHEFELYVCDYGSKRVQIFGQDGIFKRKINLEFDCGGIAFWHSMIVLANRTDHQIHVFNKQGELQTTLGNPGKENGQLQNPEGIYCDGNDLYVADYFNDRVEVFDMIEGGWVRNIGIKGGKDEKLSGPRTVRVIGTHLYVGDLQGCVKVYNKLSGDFEKMLGTKGKGKGQFAASVSGLLGVNGRLYVSDYNNYRVHIWE